MTTLRVQLGFAATEADIDPVMTSTREGLVAATDCRAQDVVWNLFPARAAGHRVLEEFGVDLDRTPDIAGLIQEYPDGKVIVAMAEVAS